MKRSRFFRRTDHWDIEGARGWRHGFRDSSFQRDCHCAVNPFSASYHPSPTPCKTAFTLASKGRAAMGGVNGKEPLLAAIANSRGWIDDIRLGCIGSLAEIAERVFDLSEPGAAPTRATYFTFDPRPHDALQDDRLPPASRPPAPSRRLLTIPSRSNSTLSSATEQRSA
jgi:hypothetical protein